MCSTEGAALRRVAEAIDRLEADRRNTDAADLEARVAAVWSMVSEIDPELARLASGYARPADEDRALRAGPGRLIRPAGERRDGSAGLSGLT